MEILIARLTKSFQLFLTRDSEPTSETDKTYHQLNNTQAIKALSSKMSAAAASDNNDRESSYIPLYC